jgi:hypothetical protein
LTFFVLPFASQCSAEGLVGGQRNDFLEDNFKGCFQKQLQISQPYPPTALAQYCLCSAIKLADRVSLEDLSMAHPALATKMQPIINSIAESCADRLK